MDWYPWYFTLYEQDTMHLNPYQDGCYRRLIDHYMKTRAPLPDSDHALARIIGDSFENWIALASETIRPFFKQKSGKLFHNRCDRELSYQDSQTKRLSESGKKGAEARKAKSIKINNLPSTPSATLKPPLSPCLSTGQDSTIQDSKEDSIIPITTIEIHNINNDGGKKSEKIEPPKEKPKINPKDYWFFGNWIRLNEKDYKAFFARYSDGGQLFGKPYDNFENFLRENDQYISTQPPEKQAGWFNFLSRKIQKIEDSRLEVNRP